MQYERVEDVEEEYKFEEIQSSDSDKSCDSKDEDASNNQSQEDVDPNAKLMKQFQVMDDKQVMQQIAAVKISSMNSKQVERVISKKGRLSIKMLPSLSKVMSLGAEKLIRILTHCPYSDHYGWNEKKLIQKFPTDNQLRQQTVLKILQWQTLRALPDISERSHEQSNPSQRLSQYLSGEEDKEHERAGNKSVDHGAAQDALI